MLREHAKVIDQLSQIADLAMVALAFFLSLELYRQKGSFDQVIETHYFIIFVVYLLIWVLIANANNLYTSRRMATLQQELGRLIRTVLSTISSRFPSC